MNEKMNENLKDRLEALVPEAPDTDLAAGAQRYARKARRRRGAAAAAALAVVAVTVPFALRGGSDSPVATVPDLPVIQCPERNAAAGPDALAADPVRARLCLPEGYPRDLLETDLDSVVALVNQAEPTPEEPICPAIADPGWSIVFQYDDASTQTVAGTPTCGLVHVGGTDRIDSGEIVPAFHTALGQQRAGQEPPGLSADVSCDRAGANTPLVGELALTELVLCTFRNGELVDTMTLSAADLKAVNVDFNLRAEAPTVMPSCVAEEVGHSLVGTNAWGDLVVMGGYCMGFLAGDLTWDPSSEVKDALGLP